MSDIEKQNEELIARLKDVLQMFDAYRKNRGETQHSQSSVDAHEFLKRIGRDD